jgi:hypothetical protein
MQAFVWAFFCRHAGKGPIFICFSRELIMSRALFAAVSICFVFSTLTVADPGRTTWQGSLNQEPYPVQQSTCLMDVPGEDVAVWAGYYECVPAADPQIVKTVDPSTTVKIQEFVKIDGLLHGIVFDGNGHMLIGRNGKQIFKVSPDGAASLFVEIKEAEGYLIEGPGDTFLYDMVFDSHGNLYAAVEDRILKIAPDGKYSTLLEQKFTGMWGVCGIALDRNGNVFYAYDNRIMKLNPSGSSELILNGEKSAPVMEAIVGIAFDADYRHLFACDGKLGSGKLIKIPISAKGDPNGPVQVIFRDKNMNTGYITFDKNGNPIVKGPWSAPFIRVQDNGITTALKHATIGYGIQTIARGGKGFDENAIFGTHMPGGLIYKIDLP